jgi:Family of unknown function (DUF5647)
VIDESTRLSPAQIARTNANLRLVARFIEEYLDDPERFDGIPNGASIVLLSPDDEGDPQLKQANLRMAQRFAAEGRNVVLWAVGTPDSEESQLLVGHPAAGEDT